MTGHSSGRRIWRAAIEWLGRYCRERPAIRHCFVRHSATMGWQNPLLSDFDLTFFVSAADFGEAGAVARRIRSDLWRTRVMRDVIVLPATDTAYRMCATHYPLRAIYPMSSWLCVHGEQPSLPAARTERSPLDHSPEAFLCSYLLPAMLGRRQRHRLEGLLVRRKLQQDSLQVTGVARRRAGGFYGVLAEEIRLWDEFFATIDGTQPAEEIQVRPWDDAPCREFASRWKSDHGKEPGVGGSVSVWVYPAFNNDDAPHVVVNLRRSVTALECKTISDRIVSTFRGLEFDLQLGTEGAMLGRLAGLSRVTLLEPWLFRASGLCLHGDPELRSEVGEPSLGTVRAKLEEFLLYLSYRLLPGTTSPPYSVYRLCFTLDHLFKHRELVVGADDLFDIYGPVFLRPREFLAAEPRKELLGVLRELHGFDLFDRPAIPHDPLVSSR